MKRIVLFYPAHKFGGPVQPRIELPQSLLTIATPLDRAGYNIRIIDQRLESCWREILSEEVRKAPICVGISAMTGPQIRNALDASRLVRQHGSVPIVWGGIHPTLMPEQTLENENVDIVVQGEGEETFFGLVKALENGTPLGSVNGIWYKVTDRIVRTSPRALIDLNQQPPLSYHLVDLKKYLVELSGQPHISLETSRGCQFKCQYCYDTIVYKSRWRGLSVDETLRRIKLLVNDYGVKGFLFTDDNFFGVKERAIAIFKRLNEEELGITCSKVDGHLSVLATLSNQELRLLRDAGCRRLMVGVESGSPRILKMLRKELDVSKLLEFNKRVIPYDMIPHYFFMMGYPTETEDELSQTVSLFLRVTEENKTAIPRLNVFTPFPGTGLYEISVRNGLSVPERLEDWVSFNWRTITRNAGWLSEKRKKLIRMLHLTAALALRNNFIAPYKKTSFLVRLLATIYYPIARIRVKKLFYRFPLELRLAEWTGVYPKQE